MNIFVTGGCGYKGTVLVPKLLALGHSVQVLDSQWFGNFLPSHPNLTVTKGDVREIDTINLTNIDIVIHLSSVANDNPHLATPPLSNLILDHVELPVLFIVRVE